ncbi:MAG: PaaI family thioesterase [Pseudomonadota bacterium]
MSTALPTPDQLNDQIFPFAKLLGISVVHVEADLIEAVMPVRNDLCTSGPLAHGGALMAFADTLGGIGTFVNLPDDASGTTTIESKTNFLRAGAVGTTLKGRCQPLHRGRTTQVWQTTISSEEGKPVAIVTQTQMVLRAA